jgi:glucan phosphorylase
MNVLEVAMEIALTPEVLEKINEGSGASAAQQAAMSTSVGGIGPLLRERIIAQGEKGLNVVGVSLLYETVWAQGWHAWNHLFLRRYTVAPCLRQTLEDTGLLLSLSLFDGTVLSVKVWKTPYGKASVYFLDCPPLTRVVYPCGEDAPPSTPYPDEWAEHQRLGQSWLVGRGALALAKTLNFRPDFIVQSETPTLFGHPHLFQDEFQKDPFFAETRCLFNDHTPMEYAHPIWSTDLLNRVKADPALYTPFVHDNKVDVTQLLVAKADAVFGVAQKHAEVMKAMPSLRDYSSKIQSITNGVSQELWQHPVFRSPENLSDKDLIEAKENLKTSFLDWFWRRANLWPYWARNANDKALLFWTRRVTSYKRLDLLPLIFNDPALRERFLKTQIVLVVGGRVYQRDNVSEKMVYDLVNLLNRDEAVGNRVVFLHNFNVWEAPRQFHAADGSIMLSNDGREASATGFMKAQMNGALTIANPDGAIPEFVLFKGQEVPPQVANGFGVSYTRGEPDVHSFVQALEDFDAVYKDPSRRAAMMRSALAVTPRVSVARTAEETLKLYRSLT